MENGSSSKKRKRGLIKEEGDSDGLDTLENLESHKSMQYVLLFPFLML